MKKKDIDLFGLLLGVLIGGIIGFFLGDIDQGSVNVSSKEEEVYGNIYLIEATKTNDKQILSDVSKQLEKKGIYFEVVEVSSEVWAIYLNIYGSLDSAKADQEKMKTLGFDCQIVTYYILDYAKNALSNQYEFYDNMINCLYKSLKEESYTIDEQYYADPINIEVFSNISLIQTIRNEQLRQQLQLNTYKIIYDKLK